MYHVVPDPAVFDQVAAIPSAAQAEFLRILDVLEITPWNGEPQHEANPDGAVRRWTFGENRAGQVVYLILEDLQEVHILLVLWLG
ncbi:hypothetical protein JOF56_009731 [Kibdelosporangium banguiense]|uniref:Type II toxin-antitoxin system RelE/ParE family toxin n=1 Tax=Kibdelosporangium banguiense TaxID=1365924 RepID=A0ABS4TYA3_9PSEU|nr:hypothetical protein [Kibdelosporangium banguiense]MBP2329346.1 hypothetical protein [Kibdelosporangium banguiense]